MRCKYYEDWNKVFRAAFKLFTSILQENIKKFPTNASNVKAHHLLEIRFLFEPAISTYPGKRVANYWDLLQKKILTPKLHHQPTVGVAFLHSSWIVIYPTSTILSVYVTINVELSENIMFLRSDHRVPPPFASKIKVFCKNRPQLIPGGMFVNFYYLDSRVFLNVQRYNESIFRKLFLDLSYNFCNIGCFSFSEC